MNVGSTSVVFGPTSVVFGSKSVVLGRFTSFLGLDRPGLVGNLIVSALGLKLGPGKSSPENGPGKHQIDAKSTLNQR